MNRAILWSKRVLLPFVDVRHLRGQIGVVSIALYLALSGASIAYGLGGEVTPDNALGGEVRWDTSQPRYPVLVISNLSRHDWTGVQVLVDDRYFYEFERVQRGLSESASMADFEDGYFLPRPEGMYTYEIFTTRPQAEGRVVPESFRPSRVVVTTDQGTLESSL